MSDTIVHAADTVEKRLVQVTTRENATDAAHGKYYLLVRLENSRSLLMMPQEDDREKIPDKATQAYKRKRYAYRYVMPNFITCQTLAPACLPGGMAQEVLSLMYSIGHLE